MQKKAKNCLLSLSEISGQKPVVNSDINAWNQTHSKKCRLPNVTPPVKNRSKEVETKVIDELKRLNLLLQTSEDEKPNSRRHTTSFGGRETGRVFSHVAKVTPDIKKYSSSPAERDQTLCDNLVVKSFKQYLDNKQNLSILINMKPNLPPNLKPPTTNYQSLSVKCRKKSISRVSANRQLIHGGTYYACSNSSATNQSVFLEQNIRTTLHQLEKKDKSIRNLRKASINNPILSPECQIISRMVKML